MLSPHQVSKIRGGATHELPVTTNGLHPLITVIIQGLPHIRLQVIPVVGDKTDQSFQVPAPYFFAFLLPTK